MLSFEISAVDLVLFVAVIILFLLYLRFSTNFDWLKKEKRLDNIKTVEERPIEREEVKERKERIVVPLISGKCPYNFGYLRRLSDESSIPAECLECSRILECRYEIISDSE
jgi:hypothetical protein